jgi:DNA-binding NarL/FixJ family response regulator
MNKTVTIFIADDHPVFREGLIKILEREKQFSILGVTGNGDDALSQIRNTKPDVAILDISMPGKTGLEIVKLLHEEECPTHPVILTMYPEEELLDEAMESGVTGYILKDSTSTEIIDCVKTVIGGGYYISKLLVQNIVGRQKKKNPADDTAVKLTQLTPTEKHVLQLLAENKTSVQIAKEMFISVKTVKNHRVNISAKLSLSGYNALLQFALEHKGSIL